MQISCISHIYWSSLNVLKSANHHNSTQISQLVRTVIQNPDYGHKFWQEIITAKLEKLKQYEFWSLPGYWEALGLTLICRNIQISAIFPFEKRFLMYIKLVFCQSFVSYCLLSRKYNSAFLILCLFLGFLFFLFMSLVKTHQCYASCIEFFSCLYGVWFTPLSCGDGSYWPK